MTGHQGYWKCFPSLTQEAALGGGGVGILNGVLHAHSTDQRNTAVKKMVHNFGT